MYTIASNEITSRIESYKALWGMWIEDAQSGEPVAYDGIQNVQTDIQATSLSDDIELGAVCSQSVTAELVDDGTKYLGNEYVFSLYTKDATSSDTSDEKIPMGRFTCVKSKKSGGSAQLTMADRLYFPTNHMCRISLCQTGIKPLKMTYADSLVCRMEMIIRKSGYCVTRTAEG